MNGRHAEWLDQWRAGATFRVIAAGAGVNESTVRRALAPATRGLRRPGPRKRAEVTVAEVVDAYQQVGSIRGVERELGVSETLVRARLYEAGVIAEHPDQRPRKTG